MPEKKNNKKEKNHYLTSNRIIDVVLLIKILAGVKKFAYRSEEELAKSINNPVSSDNWKKLASEHPEFFKVSPKSGKIILLMRFIDETANNNNRRPLSIEETQRLVDWALQFQEKQILWHQRDNFKSRIHSALIAAGVSILVAFSTLFYSNSSVKDIENSIKGMEEKLVNNQKSNMEVLNDKTEEIENQFNLILNTLDSIKLEK